MTAEQSIFEHISSHIEDGRLACGFCLADFDEPDSPVRFADGALDGISVYHMAAPALPESVEDDIFEALLAASNDSPEAARETLLPLLQEFRTVNLVDQIQHAVMQHADRMDAGALLRYATQLLFTERDKEMVKLGLTLVELFNEPIRELKEVVFDLGLCDEFTIFAAWCARTWENGNDNIFTLARHARGWGRIHCVELLAPETDEIKDWLLREGACNEVMPEYSAATCMQKADVRSRLEAPLPAADLEAVSFLLEHSIKEDGPLAALPMNSSTKQLIELYLERVGEHAASGEPLDDTRSCLDGLAEFCESAGWGELSEACRRADA